MGSRPRSWPHDSRSAGRRSGLSQSGIVLELQRERGAWNKTNVPKNRPHDGTYEHPGVSARTPRLVALALRLGLAALRRIHGGRDDLLQRVPRRAGGWADRLLHRRRGGDSGCVPAGVRTGSGEHRWRPLRAHRGHLPNGPRGGPKHFVSADLLVRSSLSNLKKTPCGDHELGFYASTSDILSPRRLLRHTLRARGALARKLQSPAPRRAL